MTWTEFLRSQAAVACDFATIDTVTLRRYYLLFSIHIPTRQVFLGGITTNPTGAWTARAARNLALRHPDLLADAGALARDRGSQFVAAFDEIFATDGLTILKTPVRTPVANAFAERWIGTLRRELSDRTLIWNQRHLNRLVVDYLDPYNTHRPPTPSSSNHRSLLVKHGRNRHRLSSEPSDQPAATDSSTNTETPHDQPRPPSLITRHPHPSEVHEQSICEGWPGPTEQPPEFTGTGAGSILMMGATGDMSTPLTGTRDLAEKLEEGVLLISDEYSHGAGGDPRSSEYQCHTDTLKRYLIDLEPPVNGSICRPGEPQLQPPNES